MKDVIVAWAPWHPEKGFDEYTYEGAVAYGDLCDNLLFDVKDLNEDDPQKRWKAVKVEIRRV